MCAPPSGENVIVPCKATHRQENMIKRFKSLTEVDEMKSSMNNAVIEVLYRRTSNEKMEKVPFRVPLSLTYLSVELGVLSINSLIKTKNKSNTEGLCLAQSSVA